MRRLDRYVSIPHRYAKNKRLYILFSLNHWFQFLIGTLKTLSLTTFPQRDWKVSIPHRYAKNFPDRKL